MKLHSALMWWVGLEVLCVWIATAPAQPASARRRGDTSPRARRPVSITLARTWAALSLVERVRFMGSLLSCGDVSADTVEQLRVRRRWCHAGRRASRVRVGVRHAAPGARAARAARGRAWARRAARKP